MRLPFTTLTTGTATSVDSQATASITPAPNRLVLLAVVSDDGEGTPGAPTVSGNGLTWVQVASVVFGSGSGYRVSLFRAMGSAPTAGAATITLGGTVQNTVTWWVGEVQGVLRTGTNGSGAIVQSATATAVPGSTSNPVAMSAFNEPPNPTLGVFALNANNNVTPKTGFTELSDTGQALARLFIEYRDEQDTSVDCTFAAAASGGIAVELAPAVSIARRALILATG